MASTDVSSRGRPRMAGDKGFGSSRVRALTAVAISNIIG